MAQKVRVKGKELEALVDAFESSYMFQQPLPKAVGIEKDYIHVHYDRRRRVAPLGKSDLFTSFAKLAAHGKPTEKKIERWVGRFGLPVWDVRPEQVENGTKDTVPEYKPMSMEVKDFRREARFANELLHLYALIRGKDVAAIKARVRALRSNLDQASALDQMFYENYRANMRSLLHEALDKRTDSYPEANPSSEHEPGLTGTRARLRERVDMVNLLSAQSALGDITTSLVSNVELRVGVQRGQGLAPSYECPDLLSAIYLQFYLLVTRNKVPRFCENPACGELFFPTKSNQRHCPVDACRSNAGYHRNAATK
jgi:hypothetical protein